MLILQQKDLSRTTVHGPRITVHGYVLEPELPMAVSMISTVVERLRGAYPDAEYPLDAETPLQLLVATILAAQCTDERVNQVTPTLFAQYPDAAAFASADLATLEDLTRAISFNRKKVAAIKESCQMLVDEHGGEVPRDIEELIKLPRVARKTANVVLNVAYHQADGIIVDTHSARVAGRLGLTTQTKPERIEQDLMDATDKKDWLDLSLGLVQHGRAICTASNPACGNCVLEDICPKKGV